MPTAAAVASYSVFWVEVGLFLRKKCTVTFVFNPKTKTCGSAHGLWGQREEDHAKHMPGCIGFCSLVSVCLSAGGKQEASDDREGKESLRDQDSRKSTFSNL